MTGVPVGLDMTAALEVADAMGLDRAVAVELLPMVEAGMLEGLAERSDEGQPP